jgi:hypothetical protein
MVNATRQLVRELAVDAGYEPKAVIQRLEYGSFVSRNNRYCFVETPKAASTSFKWLLIDIEGAKYKSDLLPYMRETRKEMLVHQRKYVDIPTLLDLDPSEAQQFFEAGSGWFVFAVSRDPYSRIVSMFNDKVRFGEPGYRELQRRYGNTSYYGGLKQAFQAFVVEYVAEKDNRNGNPHLQSQSALLMPSLIPYTRIYKLNDANKAMRDFLHHLREIRGDSRPETWVLPELNRNLTFNWRGFYGETSASVIAQCYSEDFVAFGYDPDDWRCADDVFIEESAADVRWLREVVARNEFIDGIFDLLNPFRKR